MAGEVKRSGFSNPESINLINQIPPKPPTGFQVDEWGLSSSGMPDELPTVSLKWKAPTELFVTISDGYGDDVYDTGSSVATLSGTYSTNDTTLTMSDSATVVEGDRLLIGADTTRYIVDSTTGTSLTILYGLLSDIGASGTDVKLINKTANSPATYRLITCDAQDQDSVSVAASYGFDYRLGWTIGVDVLEWEDLDEIGGYLSSTVQDYYVLDGIVYTDGAYATGETIISTVGNPSSQGITTSSTLSFGTDYENTYTIDAVGSASITLSTALNTAIVDGDSIWIAQSATFADYSNINVDEFTGGKAISTNLGGYKIYYASSPISDAATGTILTSVAASDITVDTSGYSNHTYSATSHTFDGERFYFGISAYDDNVPANESTLDASPWVITNPGQASITSSTQAALALTVTYLNITATGSVVSGTQVNNHLYDSMGGDDMTQYSINGGYNLYLVDFTNSSGTYAEASTSVGNITSADFAVGDIVVATDKGNSVQWTAHCVIAGQVALTNDQINYGSDLTDYIGTGAPSNTNITIKYLRITDRTTDTVLALDVDGNQQYLTDFQDTHIVTLTANTDQGVIIESVDLFSGSGIEEL